MNILVVYGGPRKHGHTAALISAFEDLMAGRHTVEKVDVVDYHVGGCRGCDVCQKDLDDLGCAQKDDGPVLLRRILAADAVVYACPVYCWSFPAQMKALIDRHYCTVKWRDDHPAVRLLEGKRMALAVTCGGSAQENADLLEAEWRRNVDYLGGISGAVHVLDHCGMERALSESVHARIPAVAARMAAELTGT